MGLNLVTFSIDKHTCGVPQKKSWDYVYSWLHWNTSAFLTLASCVFFFNYKDEECFNKLKTDRRRRSTRVTMAECANVAEQRPCTRGDVLDEYLGSLSRLYREISSRKASRSRAWVLKTVWKNREREKKNIQLYNVASIGVPCICTYILAYTYWARPLFSSTRRTHIVGRDIDARRDRLLRSRRLIAQYVYTRTSHPHTVYPHKYTHTHTHIYTVRYVYNETAWGVNDGNAINIIIR